MIFLYFCSNGSVPLELTLQPTLGLSSRLQKSGIRDQNPEKKRVKNLGQFHFPDSRKCIPTCQDQDPDLTLGSRCFSP